MASEAHREWVERAGAKYLPDIGVFRLTGHDITAKSAEHFVTDPGLEQMQNLFGENLRDYMPAITDSLRSALSHLHRLDPGREVVIINETFHFGALALKLGAKLPEGYDRLPKTLGVSIIPLFWTSIDAGPTSPDAQLRFVSRGPRSAQKGGCGVVQCLEAGARQTRRDPAIQLRCAIASRLALR